VKTEAVRSSATLMNFYRPHGITSQKPLLFFSSFSIAYVMENMSKEVVLSVAANIS
jgi:hypothetical protein